MDNGLHGTQILQMGNLFGSRSSAVRYVSKSVLEQEKEKI